MLFCKMSLLYTSHIWDKVQKDLPSHILQWRLYFKYLNCKILTYPVCPYFIMDFCILFCILFQQFKLLSNITFLKWIKEVAQSISPGQLCVLSCRVVTNRWSGRNVFKQSQLSLVTKKTPTKKTETNKNPQPPGEISKECHSESCHKLCWWTSIQSI